MARTIDRSELSKICRPLLTIPYYPRDDHDLVLEQVERFADHPDRLRWLIDAAVNAMDAWAGVSQLRALWCTRWAPLDRAKPEPICTLRGHTPSAIESEKAYHEQERKQLELTSPLGAITAGEMKCLPLPEKEIAANLELKTQIGRSIQEYSQRSKLKPEDGYKPPNWLKNLA